MIAPQICPVPTHRTVASGQRRPNPRNGPWAIALGARWGCWGVGDCPDFSTKSLGGWDWRSPLVALSV